MRIAVFNQKGGVGKTTTALNLAAAAHRKQQPVICIDLDPQAHLTATHGGIRHGKHRSLHALFEGKANLDSLLVDWPGIGKLLPADSHMLKIDSIFGDKPNIIRQLNESLNQTKYDEQQVFMDCCPFLGVLALNAMAAADMVLVPVASDLISLRGAQQIGLTLNALEGILKRPVNRRYVLTRFDRRRKMSTEVRESMQELYDKAVCETVISESAALMEALSRNLDIYRHAPGNRTAKEYSALLDELES